MPTDQEIIEQVEKLLEGPALQKKILETVAKSTEQFLGAPITERVKAALQSSAVEGIRQVLESVRPDLLTDRVVIKVVNDGRNALMVRVEMELPT